MLEKLLVFVCVQVFQGIGNVFVPRLMYNYDHEYIYRDYLLNIRDHDGIFERKPG